MAALNISFSEWTRNATEEEIEQMIATVKKKYYLWLFISIIPLVNWVTMGFAIFCYNNLSLLKSRGLSSGNNLWRMVLMLYAIIIPPIISVLLCARSASLAKKVTGL